ncbi:NAD(P)H-dependent oxidoreductase [Myroides odoratus]|uniref:NAD(P)H-dependent oxidoreductase n=1 Tax=Myroides odoratus TaxID=256 RepID=UPI0039AFDAEA
MKTLVIIAHPNLETSLTNKLWMEELQKDSENFHIHCLYTAYPDEKIDVEKEQALIEAYDKIIFQFPFYWFSSPPLVKKWLDEVLTYGWAYGSTSGYKLQGKKIGLVISVGIDEIEYRVEGKYGYTLKELIAPFELTFNYVKANYIGFYAYYGIEQDTTVEWVAKSIPGYKKFIESIGVLNRG